MKTQEAAGPSVDVFFFTQLRAVFDKYPEAGQKYSIHFLHDEIDGQKVDYSKQHAVSRAEGERIVTEFHDNTEMMPTGSFHACCEWYYDNGRWRCIRQCLE